MSATRIPTRQRIVDTALELFSRQGVTDTTTKQIADRAEVNEVTLFRHFGSKHGLLLAVLHECLQKYMVLTQVGESFMLSEISGEGDLSRFLRYYVHSALQALESVPELVRSLVGEAGQYPKESRQALGQGIAQINQTIARSLSDALGQANLDLPIPTIKLANLLNTCILGYAVLLLTSDARSIWENREEFVSTVVETLLQHVEMTGRAIDISADAVRGILLQAKKLNLLDYAVAYVLFASGLRSEEIVCLCRDDYGIEGKGGVLRIGEGNARLVPVNHKILGHRYGSAGNNPLVTYLKSRKDNRNPMFVKSDGSPFTQETLQQLWFQWTRGYRNQDGSPLDIGQARHTWGVEMLMRGMDVGNFRIISGLKSMEVQMYQRRVREKVAIEQAIALDT